VDYRTVWNSGQGLGRIDPATDRLLPPIRLSSRTNGEVSGIATGFGAI
jgi:hypothetical protein